MTQANFERGLAVQQVTRLKHEIDELNRDRCAVGLYCHIVKRVCVCVCVPWSKKTSRTLNRKNKTNDSVTQDKNRSQTVRDQTSG